MLLINDYDLICAFLLFHHVNLRFNLCFTLAIPCDFWGTLRYLGNNKSIGYLESDLLFLVIGGPGFEA